MFHIKQWIRMFSNINMLPWSYQKKSSTYQFTKHKKLLSIINMEKKKPKHFFLSIFVCTQFSFFIIIYNFSFFNAACSFQSRWFERN